MKQAKTTARWELIQFPWIKADSLQFVSDHTFVGLSPWLSISLNVLIPSTRHGTILDTLESFLPKGWIVTLTVNWIGKITLTFYSLFDVEAIEVNSLLCAGSLNLLGK